MRAAKPSRTALRVAMQRAAHQLLDHPKVFEDPLAVAIAGRDSLPPPDAQLPYARALRAFLAVRSRYAEDLLAAAVERGVRQYVVLGAGLDTFAYRNPWRSAGLHVFEVDHPATQDWKRGQLRQAGIAIPDEMTFAAMDFERQSLDEGLAAAGCSKQEPAFFSWLGVTPYLSRAAFDATIGSSPQCPWAAVSCSTTPWSDPYSARYSNWRWTHWLREWLERANHFDCSSILPR